MIKSSSAPHKKPKKKPKVPLMQLLKSDEIDWELYYFDEDAANLPIEFAEKFTRHIKGEWAGKPVIFDEWEKIIIRTVFGWKRIEDGLRRYSTLYLEIPRKNGKSLIASVLGLFLSLCDREPGAEVYSAATNRRQAEIVFNAAKSMVRKSPKLSSMCKPYKKTIVIEQTDTVYEVLSADADTKDGLNAHGIIFDELHAQKKRDLYDVLRTSCGSRRQPLEVYITTAGTDITSICFEVHDYAEKVKKGIIKDDTFLGCIFAAGADDDWKDPAVWAKANPGLGTSVKLKYLEKRCKEAMAKPSFLNTFKRLHLNIWTAAGESWLPWDLWAKCAGDFTEESLYGQQCWLALDLSRTIDITAMTAVFVDQETNGLKSVCRFWMPEDRAEEAQDRDRVPYLDWAEQGYLSLIPGEVIHAEPIAEVIKYFYEKFDVQETAFDPWQSIELSNLLQKDQAILPVAFKQNYSQMSAPMKDLEKFLLQRKFTHSNNPLMNWMMSSVVVKTDDLENIRPDKKKSRNRIDGPVSLIMATGRCLNGTNHLSSVYEDKDLAVI